MESVITYQHNEFSSRYCVKNFNSLLDEGKLKFLGAQDLYSFTGQRKLTIRKATVKGKLSTLMGYCFSDKDILQAFGQLLVYLHALHYPKWIIVGELHKLYESSRETIWKLLAVLTQNAYPSITSSSSTKMRWKMMMMMIKKTGWNAVILSAFQKIVVSFCSKIRTDNNFWPVFSEIMTISGFTQDSSTSDCLSTMTKYYTIDYQTQWLHQ